MHVFLNGRFVPEEQAVVSVFDRGFLYGDGLFETLLVRDGRPLFWAEHLARLQRGAALLKLSVPFEPAPLRQFAGELIGRNRMSAAVLRLTLSRGVGLRGYSTRGAESPTLVMTLHPAPPAAVSPLQWRLLTASWRVPANDPLAQVKTCNKLVQILARAEAEAASVDEAVVLNTNGDVAETAGGSLFWIQGETVCTTPVASGVLAGVTRGVLLEICRDRGVATREVDIQPDALACAQGVFVTTSTLGVIEAVSLDGQPLSRALLTTELRGAYEQLISSPAADCGR